jgi:hypothetical protein
MQFLNRNIACLLLWLLLLPAGLLAQEKVDCIDYSGSEPDPRCVYQRLEAGPKGVGLFVVPAGKDAVRENALPNTDFYVYAPKAASDSVEISLRESGKRIYHMDVVNSGATGEIVVAVNAKYPIYNVVVGTALSVDGDFAIARVYNYYVPSVQYCLDLDCNEPISDVTKIQLEVGDSLVVYARLFIPVGPDKDVTDSTLEKTFYIKPLESALRYYSLSGVELPLRPFGYQIDFHSGRAVFVIHATKAVVGDDSPFSMNSYVDTTGGDTNFIVTQEFPGSLQFVNPDMPVLDSAFIFDTNGDGAGDSIAAYFSGRKDSVEMEKFFYDWPNGGKFVEHDGEWDWSKNTGLLELTNVKSGVPEDSGNGTLKVDMKSVNTGASASAEGTMVDRIGPVILEANLIPGDGATDTLELFYNKPIDESWNEGKGYILNGTPINLKTIKKDGKRWVFVLDTGIVDFGDSIKIATTCADKACPDGLVKAADGNKTGKNNPAVIKNSGRKYSDDERNGFYDRDGDGRMDSASVAFKNPISQADLEKMTFRYYWLDTNGQVVEIVPDVDKLTLSDDGTLVGFALNLKKDEYGIREKLTSIDMDYSKSGEEYGYVTVTYFETVEGEKKEKTDTLGMHDRMAPVISGTFLKPESYQKMASDVFFIEFSEAIDYKNVEGAEDAFKFHVDGEWVSIPFTGVVWAPDGKSAEIRMESGTRLVERMNPADSVRFDESCLSFKDSEGNGLSGLAPAVMVEGDPRVITQNYSFASIQNIDESVDEAITFEVADGLTSEEAHKALGVLMDVSFATILKEETDDVEMDLSKIGMDWELYVYTNLGVFVAKASEKIKCDDRDIFDGNCFENPHQLYLRWNMRDNKGRRVGVGAYVAHIKVRVYGAKESFKVERYYNWGITGSRKIRSKD